MQRIAFPTFLTAFLAFTPAFSGPLNLNPQAQPAATSAQSGIGSVFAQAPAEPAPMRYAATESNYGGGFIEMLFRGPGGAPPQRQYQPEPQSNPVYGRAHTNDQDIDDPQSRQVNPRFLRQEVS